MATKRPPRPLLSDPSAVRAWLEGPGKRQVVRLPVVVHRGLFGIEDAFLAGVPADQALRLYLDDTALGIPLAEHVRTDCPLDQSCTVWIEAVWGPTVAGSPLIPEGHHIVSVRRYGGRVDTLPTRLQAPAVPPVDGAADH